MDKAVLVYGIGISGCGAAEILARGGKRVLLYNDAEHEVNADLKDLLAKNGGQIVIGGGEKLLDEVEEVILSPGISLENPLVQEALRRGINVTGEAELAYRNYNGHIIGITGTNGKTTTTTLVGEMLATLPCVSKVGGNIGMALTKEVETMPDNSWLAAELSSFQLETIQNFRAEIAVILNLTEDHLTRHHTMEAYGAAKCNIFKNQRPEDVTLLNFDDPIVKSWGGLVPGRLCWFSRREILPQGIYMDNGNFVIAWNDTKEVICNKKDLQIFGGHNEENVLAAIGAAFFAGVRPYDIAAVLKNFKGVEHRIEYTATVNGVPYYNDSKATNTDSTIKALEAFANGHLILIAGGTDKLTPLEEMMALVKTKVDTLILLGEAAERFNEAAVKAGVADIRRVKSMREAVELAHKIAVKPQTVLLSPACASFDMFSGFPARGRCFKEIVAEIAAAEEQK